LRGQLVILGKTALDCQEADKRVDRLLHDAKLGDD
jgi:hypothetical protein